MTVQMGIQGPFISVKPVHKDIRLVNMKLWSFQVSNMWHCSSEKKPCSDYIWGTVVKGSSARDFHTCFYRKIHPVSWLSPFCKFFFFLTEAKFIKIIRRIWLLSVDSVFPENIFFWQATEGKLLKLFFLSIFYPFYCVMIVVFFPKLFPL